MELDRNVVLGGLLAGTLVLTYFILEAVVQVIVFAVTIAYVMYPVREFFRHRGLSRRVSSGLATLTVFVALLAILAPMFYAVYGRRTKLLDVVADLPESASISVAGFEREVALVTVRTAVESALRDQVVDIAVALPALALAVALFTLVLYGILYRPGAVRTAVFGLVPPRHHDILQRLHETTRTTLYAIYIIQAATAAGTFLVAVVIFWLLGYPTPLWLAFASGVLQFVPIIGPSILIIGLAGADIVIYNMPVRAVAVLVLGLVFIGFAPDVAIRPKLAARTGTFSSTLYFVGFVGGILTVGVIGFIVGPLIVALLVEIVQMLSEEQPPLESGAEPNSEAGEGEPDFQDAEAEPD